MRLAARLAEAVAAAGDAYRLGGDEFCVLVSPGRDGIDALLAACSAALNERGEGFEVTSSFGVVVMPEEAHTPTLALQLADRRMYARKGGRRCRPAASRATSCSGRCPSGAPASRSASETSESWRWRSGGNFTWGPRG